LLFAVANHVAEAGSQVAQFIGFAAVQGNAFRVFADAYQRKAKISLELLLFEIEIDQRPANDVGEPCAHKRID
jgi:hypothetical protein